LYIILTSLTHIYKKSDNYEVIIVDDGSADNTRSVIESYRSKKVKYIYQSNSGGPAKPRNVGVNAAKGDIISFLDSDDLIIPTKLADYVNIFQKFPETDLIFSDFSLIDESGKIIKRSFLEDYKSFRKIMLPTEISDVFILKGPKLYTELLYANFIGTSGVMVKKNTLKKIGKFDESMKNSDDIDMWRRFAKEQKIFAFIRKVQHFYRKRASSISAKRMERFPSMLKGLEKHIKTVDTVEDKKILNTKISELLISYGWHLRNNKLYKESLKCYLKSLTKKASCKAIKGFLATLLVATNFYKKTN